MLHETWCHFLPQQFSHFQAFFTRVKSLCLLLHGAAGSQPWRKFKPCGLEHARSCQKNPNLSVPGPFWERGFGQSNQSLTTSQCKPDSQDGGLSLRSLAQLLIRTISFHKVSAAWTLSLICHDLLSRSATKLCELGGQMQTSILSLRLRGPTRLGWT